MDRVYVSIKVPMKGTKGLFHAQPGVHGYETSGVAEWVGGGRLVAEGIIGSGCRGAVRGRRRGDATQSIQVTAGGQDLNGTLGSGTARRLADDVAVYVVGRRGPVSQGVGYRRLVAEGIVSPQLINIGARRDWE